MSWDTLINKVPRTLDSLGKHLYEYSLKLNKNLMLTLLIVLLVRENTSAKFYVMVENLSDLNKTDYIEAGYFIVKHNTYIFYYACNFLELNIKEIRKMSQ